MPTIFSENAKKNALYGAKTGAKYYGLSALSFSMAMSLLLMMKGSKGSDLVQKIIMTTIIGTGVGAGIGIGASTIVSDKTKSLKEYIDNKCARPPK